MFRPNKFSKVTWYKITQKTNAFLHTNNKSHEKEIKSTTPFIIGWKGIKYLVINLTTREGKDLYIENYKTLKEIKEDANKYKDIYVFIDYNT